MANSTLRIWFNLGLAGMLAILIAVQLTAGVMVLRGGGRLTRYEQPGKFWLLIAIEFGVATYLIWTARQISN